MSAFYIALDCETGGFSEQASLLTVCFVVLDKELNIIELLNLAIKPNNGEDYHTTAQALEVNGINLVEHNKTAITSSEAGSKSLEFLKRHSDGKVKLVPIGHNVAFDILCVHEKLLSKGHFDKYVSYCKLDTGAIMQYLKLIGKVPESVSGSLGAAAKHFGIDFKERAHTAESDTLMCVELLKKMKEL